MLSDAGIRRIKSTGKVQRHTDVGGMYLEISPAGGKWWRWKYRFGGKEKRLSFGIYPDVGLAEARGRRDAARKLLAAGIDPGEQRKAEKAATAERTGSTLGAVAREWWTKREKEIVAGTAKREHRLLETYLLPYIGQLPIGDITAPALLAALRKPEAAGKVETAHRGTFTGRAGFSLCHRYRESRAESGCRSGRGACHSQGRALRQRDRARRNRAPPDPPFFTALTIGSA